MRRLVLFLVVIATLISCEKADINKVDVTLKDPINGVSEYLLDSTVFTNSSTPTNKPTFIKYSYNLDGILEIANLKIFPENLNSKEVPYIIKDGAKLFCDLKRRVFKEEGDSYTRVYYYDENDRISSTIVTNKQYAFNDTTTYTYYAAGENNWEGISYETKSPNYTLTQDGKKINLGGSLYKIYYFSGKGEKLKSWTTLPYNYGKISEYPLSKYVYNTKSGSLRTDFFTHMFDERGLITKTTTSYLGGASTVDYYYKKR